MSIFLVLIANALWGLGIGTFLGYISECDGPSKEWCDSFIARQGGGSSHSYRPQPQRHIGYGAGTNGLPYTGYR